MSLIKCNFCLDYHITNNIKIIDFQYVCKKCVRYTIPNKKYSYNNNEYNQIPSWK